MREIPQEVSEAVRKRNPHLYGPMANFIHELPKRPAVQAPTDQAPAAKRIRQEKPLIQNKLEAGWFTYLQATLKPGTAIRPKGMRFRLANGAQYVPDFIAFVDGKLTCYECKGPKQCKNVARGILTIKFAATQWPEVDWILVWREGGKWNTQKVLS